MIRFDEVLHTQSFDQAVQSLAADFRKAHALPEIHQLGLVVKDVETAAEELEAEGLGPFFIAAGAPVLWEERGSRKAVKGRMGLAYHRGIELELLEPLEGSDFYTQSLDPEGHIMIQHLGFLVKNVDKWADILSKNSETDLYVRGRLQVGPSKTDFAYMEPLAENDLIMEFISWRLLGVNLGPPKFIFKTAGKIEKLTGKRSVSL